MALATTRIAIDSETPDSSIIVIFAQMRTGIVSVGLKAVALVKPGYR